MSAWWFLFAPHAHHVIRIGTAIHVVVRVGTAVHGWV